VHLYRHAPVKKTICKKEWGNKEAHG
jgi:hypothetical protein